MTKQRRNLPFELDEQTRVNLQFNNFWAILVSVIMVTFSSALVYFQHMRLNEKFDEMLIAQKEMKQEVKENFQEIKQWKTQVETRLGTVESRQDTVISYLENHLSVDIR